MTQEEREELREEFYKELGQYAGDPFDEIADWWLQKISQRESELIKRIVKLLEDYKEECNIRDEIYLIDEISSTIINEFLLHSTNDKE